MARMLNSPKLHTAARIAADLADLQILTALIADLDLARSTSTLHYGRVLGELVRMAGTREFVQQFGELLRVVMQQRAEWESLARKEDVGMSDWLPPALAGVHLEEFLVLK